MDNKDYFKIGITFLGISIVSLVITGLIMFERSKSVIHSEITELQRTIELQDKEILELQTKNALLKDEIDSLEIFDCTFKKFPEIRDQLLIDTFKGDLNANDK